MFGLVPGRGTQQPGHHAPGRGSQVDVTGDRGQRQPVPIRQVDHVFQLPGTAGQPVDVPAQHRIDSAGFHVAEQLLPRRPGLT
ncbi:MAG TPA: hypothetical protein VFO16_16920 [Pseudonocardiaceae bacterium]|nr:hypothetical protein [Pseudonocardiaceae bacterium]